MPTIAAVHGACLGTGLGLALACDIVYAADDARIGSPFARIGAVLDSGAHAAFVSRVGPHRALELIYTGRLLSGREAAEWGLVNRSVAGADLVRRTRELARVDRARTDRRLPRVEAHRAHASTDGSTLVHGAARRRGRGAGSRVANPRLPGRDLARSRRSASRPSPGGELRAHDATSPPHFPASSSTVPRTGSW